MHTRAVIHIELDSFVASVELARRPDLRGRQVVVGADGDPAKRGAVTAASAEALRSGVRPGMTLREAKKRAPEAVFLPADFEAYEEASDRFLSILLEYSRLVEYFAPGEAFVEIEAGPGRDPVADAAALASEMRKKIKKELGLSSSAGVAPNKLMARAASEAARPEGLRVIDAAGVDDFLKDLPVRRLWGVGARVEKRLKELGISTAGELARTPLMHMERNFGAAGRGLHERSRGVDSSPVVPFLDAASMGREVAFEEALGDFYTIKETLYALVGESAARLRSSGRAARTVSIKAGYGDLKTVVRSVSMDGATDSMNDIWVAALKLLEGVDLSVPVRLVGVKLADLEQRRR